MFMMLGNSLLEGGCSMLQSSDTVHNYHIISAIYVCSSPPHLWDLHSWKPWHWQALLETGPVDIFPIQAALLNEEAMQSRAGLDPIFHLTSITIVGIPSKGRNVHLAQGRVHRSNTDPAPHSYLFQREQCSTRPRAGSMEPMQIEPMRIQLRSHTWEPTAATAP